MIAFNFKYLRGLAAAAGIACALGGSRQARAQDTIPVRQKVIDSTLLRRRAIDSTLMDTDTVLRRATMGDSVRDTSSVAPRGAAPHDSANAPGAKRARRAGAATAAAQLWPVKGPEPLPGSILPQKRIVAFYGNPLSKRMGILGALPPEQMLDRLDREVAAWTAADSSTPVQPALHLIASVAQASPQRDGTYHQRMDSTLIERVYGWARSRGALLFLDVQLGKAPLDSELQWLAPFLQRPDVHLGLDPEFAMTRGGKPGKRVGTLDARDVNRASAMLAELVTRYDLPPKVLVVHRFTRDMLTHSRDIQLDPRVQIVIDMDGWGPPWMKRESYQKFVADAPVEFTGFKLFYRNDTKGGDRLMTPKQVLSLWPQPLYIQYQ